MPSVMQGREEFNDSPEAPSTTDNWRHTIPYGTSQHRTIVEEEGEKDEDLGACPRKVLQS